MQVPVKFFIPLLSLIISFSYLVYPVKADNLKDAIGAYESEDYKKARDMLEEEIEHNPDNVEAYSWLAKSYEALFEIDKAVKTYNKYEELKKTKVAKSSIIPLPSISGSPLKTNLKQLDKNSKSPLPKVKPTSASPLPPVNKNKIVPFSSPLPSIRPTPIPRLAKNKKTQDMIASKLTEKKTLSPKPEPTPSKSLAIRFQGWKTIFVTNLLREKKIKTIPQNSMDLQEVEDIAGYNKEFVLIECKVQYNNDIIIKNNSTQIQITDSNNKSYKLYAMSTFKFTYRGSEVSKKTEALQIADYYQLSKKDSRWSITFVFKADEGTHLKDLKIMGYKDIDLTSYNT